MASWFLIQSKKSEGKVLSFECSHQQLFWRSGPFGPCLTQKQWYLSSHCYWREHKAKSLPFCHLEDLQSLSSHLGLFGPTMHSFPNYENNSRGVPNTIHRAFAENSTIERMWLLFLMAPLSLSLSLSFQKEKDDFWPLCIAPLSLSYTLESKT